MKALWNLVALCSVTLFISCESNSDYVPPLSVSQQYDGSQFEQNTINQRAVVDQLTKLMDEARKGRVTGARVNAATLQTLFTTGTPSLKLIATPYYAGRLEHPTVGFMTELSKASGARFSFANRTGEGGVYGGYLFDEFGLEMEQLMEKGLYGAALYNYAIGLMNAKMTPATSDQVLYLLGASPSFPNSSNPELHRFPDKLMASYTSARDKNNGSGFYTRLRDSFLTLQAALKGGDEYRSERDAALNDIKQTWESANAATIIHNLQSVVAALGGGTLTEAQLGAAMHTHSEAVGLLHGWLEIPQAQKKITDDQIKELLLLMNAPYDKSATAYLLVTDRANQLPKLTQAINRLGTIYGFGSQEMEEFKKNWVSEQKR